MCLRLDFSMKNPSELSDCALMAIAPQQETQVAHGVFVIVGKGPQG